MDSQKKKILSMLDETERAIYQEFMNRTIVLLKRGWLASSQDLIEKWRGVVSFFEQIRGHVSVLLQEDEEEEQKGR